MDKYTTIIRLRIPNEMAQAIRQVAEVLHIPQAQVERVALGLGLRVLADVQPPDETKAADDAPTGNAGE